MPEAPIGPLDEEDAATIAMMNGIAVIEDVDDRMWDGNFEVEGTDAPARTSRSSSTARPGDEFSRSTTDRRRRIRNDEGPPVGAALPLSVRGRSRDRAANDLGGADPVRGENPGLRIRDRGK